MNIAPLYNALERDSKLPPFYRTRNKRIKTMAHFRAVIKGQRGSASRLGSRVSGIRADIDGWNSGVSVHAGVHVDGSDVFGIHVTGGSNRAQHEEFIGTVTVRNGKAVFIPTRVE